MPRYMTTRQIAAKEGISEPTIRKRIADNSLRPDATYGSDDAPLFLPTTIREAKRAGVFRPRAPGRPSTRTD